MRIKGKIIELGDIIGQPGQLKQQVVVEYDAEKHMTATLELWGDERVAKLQKLKVGDEVSVEFIGKWYMIWKDRLMDYNEVVVDNVRLMDYNLVEVGNVKM